MWDGLVFIWKHTQGQVVSQPQYPVPPDRGGPPCSARQSSRIQTIKDMVNMVFNSGLTIIEKKC